MDKPKLPRIYKDSTIRHLQILFNYQNQTYGIYHEDDGTLILLKYKKHYKHETLIKYGWLECKDISALHDLKHELLHVSRAEDIEQ